VRQLAADCCTFFEVLDKRSTENALRRLDNWPKHGADAQTVGFRYCWLFLTSHLGT